MMNDHRVYYIGQHPKAKERIGGVESYMHDIDGDIVYNVKLQDGSMLIEVHEDELYFLKHHPDEIERLLELNEYPEGIPGNWTQRYFQILKAVIYAQEALGA